MNNISSLLGLLNNTPVRKFKTERQYVLSQFVDEINKERLGTSYKPITGRYVAVKLAHIKDMHTLYWFLSECKDSKNRNGSFSKRFFGSLKVQNSFPQLAY